MVARGGIWDLPRCDVAPNGFAKQFGGTVSRQQTQSSGLAAQGLFAIPMCMHGFEVRSQAIPCVEAVENRSGFGRAKAATVSAAGCAELFPPDQMMSIDLHTRTFTPAAINTKAKAI